MAAAKTMAWAVFAGTAVWAVACVEPGVDDPAAPTSGFVEAPPAPPAEVDPGPTRAFADTDASLAEGDGGEGDGSTSCADDSLDAKRKPVKIVMAVDQSGSMGLVPYGDKALKWDPVTGALKAFLGDAKSKGIAASMRLFPKAADNPTLNCQAATYATPDVALTNLPDVATFAAKLPAIPPGLQTPTRAILKALVTDALAVKQASPNDAVAVLLVTDGDPIGCPNKADEVIATVAAEAKVAANAGIPVYVIGVGTIPNLDLIAAEGGTGKAFVVPVNNPTATQQQFLAAVDAIRTSQISCDLDVGEAPKGRTLAYGSANVVFKPGAGNAVSKPLDPTCAQGGFKFDDANAPKKVHLCPALCDALKADPDATVSLAIPCGTTPGGPR